MRSAGCIADARVQRNFDQSPAIGHLVPGNGRCDVRPAQAVQREGLDVGWRHRQHAAITAVHVAGQRLAHAGLRTHAAPLATDVDEQVRRAVWMCGKQSW